jgi:hypothetical protein
LALLEWSDVDEDRPLGDFLGELLDRTRARLLRA